VQGFESAGRNTSGPIPVLYCRRSAMDRAVRASLGKDLAAIEREIDNGPKPQSAVLKGWKADGEIQVERVMKEARNVVGVLEGEGPLADETVVVGAHYDHVGRQGPPGPVPPGKDVICNGADDNASGVAAMLEIARALSKEKGKPRRRLVFVAFAAEELGLFGSSHYVSDPPFPLEKTVAMINLDMVGRSQNNKFSIYGTGTSKRFDPLVDRLNGKYHFDLTKVPAGAGPSDHLAFYGRQIPVLHFFTGLHPDYHKPSDHADKINYEAMRKITEMAAEVVVDLATDAKRPEFVGENPVLEWAARLLPAPTTKSAPPEVAKPAKP
jgi:Zn-dependent M28 family amino/carboxypeptidase